MDVIFRTSFDSVRACYMAFEARTKQNAVRLVCGNGRQQLNEVLQKQTITTAFRRIDTDLPCYGTIVSGQRWRFCKVDTEEDETSERRAPLNFQEVQHAEITWPFSILRTSGVNGPSPIDIKAL